MTENEQFDIWKAKVEMHLESMVKKSSSELNVQYNYLKDFRNNTPPNITATRVIRRSYQPIGG
jgi:hypothetical protein